MATVTEAEAPAKRGSISWHDSGQYTRLPCFVPLSSDIRPRGLACFEGASNPLQRRCKGAATVPRKYSSANGLAGAYSRQYGRSRGKGGFSPHLLTLRCQIITHEVYATGGLGSIASSNTVNNSYTPKLLPRKRDLFFSSLLFPLSYSLQLCAKDKTLTTGHEQLLI